MIKYFIWDFDGVICDSRDVAFNVHNKVRKNYKIEIPSFILISILLLCFIAFTFYPPIIPLFEDPIYGTFGVEPKRID